VQVLESGRDAEGVHGAPGHIVAGLSTGVVRLEHPGVAAAVHGALGNVGRLDDQVFVYTVCTLLMTVLQLWESITWFYGLWKKNTSYDACQSMSCFAI